MSIVLKVLLILALALSLPVIGLFMLGQSWPMGAILMLAPMAIAWRLL